MLCNVIKVLTKTHQNNNIFRNILTDITSTSPGSPRSTNSKSDSILLFFFPLIYFLLGPHCTGVVEWTAGAFPQNSGKSSELDVSTALLPGRADHGASLTEKPASPRCDRRPSPSPEDLLGGCRNWCICS
jgi:hypothetical protein